jgi:hypothetical protein
MFLDECINCSSPFYESINGYFGGTIRIYKGMEEVIKGISE